MADITKIDTVDRIAQLGRDAASMEILTAVPPEGAAGVPPAVTFGYDRRNGQTRDLSDIINRWRIHPERREGTAEVDTLASFIDLTQRHKTEHSAIFADTSWPDPSLLAVIDYHEINNGKPQFGAHRVSYAFPLTEEFQAWAGKDGKPMSQVEFCAFIEERVAELASATDQEDAELGQLFQTKMATPADMLALSRGLEVNVAGRVKQSVRLSSGEGEIVFVEEHMDSKGQKIVVPGLFMVAVPAFLDSVPVRLPARLRYRVSNGAVSWFFQLYRWKELLRLRVQDDLRDAVDSTALPAYEGEPEMAGTAG